MEASFVVEIDECVQREFAELSGDWNPLHTDECYAATTTYRRPILHGAYSAGLVSRMAGMHLPGEKCLLHGMRLRFVSPIIPPAKLLVKGKVISDNGESGVVSVTIHDEMGGRLYTEATYEYGRHVAISKITPAPDSLDDSPEKYLVTGANGALGAAVCRRIGENSIPIKRTVAGEYEIPTHIDLRSVAGLVHCGHPDPDNVRLTQLDNVQAAVNHHISGPMQRAIEAAQILKKFGYKSAVLILIGSTFATRGRHAWRMPLYSISKATIPTLTEVLALELANQQQRCVSICFDVMDGGMNAGMSGRVRQMHADRSPWQCLVTVEEAADQIAWVLQNSSRLISGATINLTGGALP
jgi:3-hydroxybutyryl-CoA dehydratase